MSIVVETSSIISDSLITSPERVSIGTSWFVCDCSQLGTPRKLGQDLGKQVVSVNCNLALTVNQFKRGRPRYSVVEISNQNVRLTSRAIVIDLCVVVSAVARVALWRRGPQCAAG